MEPAQESGFELQFERRRLTSPFNPGCNTVSTPITKRFSIIEHPFSIEEQPLKVHPYLAHCSKSDLWLNARSNNLVFEHPTRNKGFLCLVIRVGREKGKKKGCPIIACVRFGDGV
jgi:hypothetical protein